MAEKSKIEWTGTPPTHWQRFKAWLWGRIVPAEWVRRPCGWILWAAAWYCAEWDAGRVPGSPAFPELAMVRGDNERLRKELAEARLDGERLDQAVAWLNVILDQVRDEPLAGKFFDLQWLETVRGFCNRHQEHRAAAAELPGIEERDK